jgi:hypothetical protein
MKVHYSLQYHQVKSVEVFFRTSFALLSSVGVADNSMKSSMNTGSQDEALVELKDPEMVWNNPSVVVEESSWRPVTGGGLGRTKSVDIFSIVSSESSFETSAISVDAEVQNAKEAFGQQVRLHTEGRPETPVFDGELRKSIEPHLRLARLQREKARICTHHNVAASIASSMRVPYTALRNEQPFLFDEHTHPLHDILAQTLNVPDLCRVHEYSQETMLRPLLDRSARHAFHAAYDSFVTSFCIPLLHSLVITKNIMHGGTAAADKITYRYQAFPSVEIVTPGSTSAGPICSSITGHSIGCLSFHIPLTPSFGTNALYVESHPGREDWHPLQCKAVGLGYVFDGTRCMHFPLDNTTSTSRVSLDFNVLIYRDGKFMGDCAGLCPAELVEDRLSAEGAGYYDEVVIDLSRAVLPGAQMVVKRHGNRLLDPDHRVGAPFV